MDTPKCQGGLAIPVFASGTAFDIQEISATSRKRSRTKNKQYCSLPMGTARSQNCSTTLGFPLRLCLSAQEYSIISRRQSRTSGRQYHSPSTDIPTNRSGSTALEP